MALDRELVRTLGAHMMAAHLAARGGAASMSDEQLQASADQAVRAALALMDAVPRHEAKVAAEAEAAEAAAREEAAAEAERYRAGQEATAAQIKATAALAARERAEAAAAATAHEAEALLAAESATDADADHHVRSNKPEA